jgi:hypothetical protein
MTVFYCLGFDTPPTWSASYLYFSSPVTTHRATVDVYESASTWGHAERGNRVQIIGKEC